MEYGGFFTVPGLLCWLGTRGEQPASSCAGVYWPEVWLSQGNTLENMFKMLSQILYVEQEPGDELSEQGVALKSQCWPRTRATAPAAAQRWGGQSSAPQLLSHAALAWLDCSSCLVHGCSPGCATVEGVQALPCSPPVLPYCSLLYSSGGFPLSHLAAGHSSWCLRMKNTLTLRQSHLSV